VAADDPIGCDVEATGATDEADHAELLRHCAFEVCRKLGRKPAGVDLRALTRGSVATLGDVDLFAVGLPIPSGHLTVVFGRVRKPGSTPLQPSFPALGEAVP
jgi:hypothetical protein